VVERLLAKEKVVSSNLIARSLFSSLTNRSGCFIFVGLELFNQLRETKARGRQRQRFKDTNLQINSDMGPAEIRQFCQLDTTGTNLIKAAVQQLQLSVRAYHHTQGVKLARTIADLTGSADIQTAHVAEAIQYRPRRVV
jgi:predicted ATPase with chaperone activity